MTVAEYEQHDLNKNFDALETEICTTKIDETGALEIIMWEFLPALNDERSKSKPKASPSPSLPLSREILF